MAKNMDFDESAKKWLEANGIEATPGRIYSLVSLLVKAEREGYTEGINTGTIFED